DAVNYVIHRLFSVGGRGNLGEVLVRTLAALFATALQEEVAMLPAAVRQGDRLAFEVGEVFGRCVVSADNGVCFQMPALGDGDHQRPHLGVVDPRLAPLDTGENTQLPPSLEHFLVSLVLP